MAHEERSRVIETFSTTGTGDKTLAGAVAGYQRVGDVHNDGATLHGVCWKGADWEIGRYTYHTGANSLTPTEIYKSTNGGAAVNWGSGDKTFEEIYVGFNDLSAAGKRAWLNLILANVVKDWGGAVGLAGGTTAYTATTNHGVTALAAGVKVHGVVNATNTGASTLAVDGLTAKPIRMFTDAGEVALAAGDMIAGEHAIFEYDPAANSAAGAWILLNPHPRQATQAQVEAAADTVVAVTPGRLQYHPGVAKAWAWFDQVGTHDIAASYNVDSLTDAGTGQTTVTIGTDFSSANYLVIANNNGQVIANGSPGNAGSFTVLSRAITASLTDSSALGAAAFGDQ